MFFNGILLSLIFSNVLSESYNIRLTRQIQERECGVIPKIKHRKDFHGLLSQFGQSPWQASIFDSRDGSFFCSGTLISSRHVVTSAACLLAISSPSSLEVRLGDWDISTQDSPYETYDHFSTSVNKVVISPDFAIVASWKQKSAVAVLKLDNEVDYVRYPHIAPLCLPPELPAHHNYKSKRQFYDQCVATGWGAENYLISSGIKKNEKENVADATKDLGNLLKPEETAYLRPVIITKPSPFPVPKRIPVDTQQKIENYEPTIIVPNLFKSIGVSKEIDMQVVHPQNVNNQDPGTRINPIGSSVLKNIDPVEEYIDLPEYLDEDGEDSRYIETEYEENVEATTHKRVSLSNMPRGEESMEVMESQRHPVIVPFNNVSAYNATRQNRSTTVGHETTKAHHIPEHESRLYRHKQKYKQGRLASRSKSRDAIDDDDFKSHPAGHLMKKRSSSNGALRIHRRKSLNDNLNININMQMNASTVLKSVQVIFRKKCRHMRTDLPEIISIANYNKDRLNLSSSNSKACIRPVQESEIPNYCMLDIGSPIVCTSVTESRDLVSNNLRQRRQRRNTNNIFKTMHHISRHVFPTFQKVKLPENFKIKLPEKKKYMPTEGKRFLTGIIAWKEPCANEEDANFNFRDTEVVSIQEILPFLLESMLK